MTGDSDAIGTTTASDPALTAAAYPRAATVLVTATGAADFIRFDPSPIRDQPICSPVREGAVTAGPRRPRATPPRARGAVRNSRPAVES